MGSKNVLIRGVDEAIFRRAKAAAASKGITLGAAVDEALASWSEQAENSKLRTEYDANLEFVRSNWSKFRPFKGKGVVVASGAIQKVFPSYEEARAFASGRYKLALVFVVDKPPLEKEIELGAEMEV